jgi:hypothetical protein
MVRSLYKKLIAFYPPSFREQLGESMEQTFNDLCNEKQQRKQSLTGFVLWTFIETALGILREHLLFIPTGVIMKAILKTLGSSTLVGLLLVLPFMIMEVVNRRNFNEDFPFALFFGLWLNLFVISLILLPIVQARRTGKHQATNPISTQGGTLLTTPKSTLIVSIVCILLIAIPSLLASFGSNQEGLSVFGVRVASQFVAFIALSLPIAAGIVAGRPIVRTLQAGGSLFAHPFHLLIVVFILATFAIGFVSFILDQWPCFIGVPNCD